MSRPSRSGTTRACTCRTSPSVRTTRSGRSAGVPSRTPSKARTTRSTSSAWTPSSQSVPSRRCSLTPSRVHIRTFASPSRRPRSEEKIPTGAWSASARNRWRGGLEVVRDLLGVDVRVQAQHPAQRQGAPDRAAQTPARGPSCRRRAGRGCRSWVLRAGSSGERSPSGRCACRGTSGLRRSARQRPADEVALGAAEQGGAGAVDPGQGRALRLQLDDDGRRRVVGQPGLEQAGSSSSSGPGAAPLGGSDATRGLGRCARRRSTGPGCRACPTGVRSSGAVRAPSVVALPLRRPGPGRHRHPHGWCRGRDGWCASRRGGPSGPVRPAGPARWRRRRP